MKLLLSYSYWIILLTLASLLFFYQLCQIGDDFISLVEAFTRNVTYDVNKYLSVLKSKYLNYNDPKRKFACYQGANSYINEGNINSFLPETRDIIAYCVEPLPSNFEMLEKIMNSFSYDRNQIILYQAAAGR